ncbi:MAG: UPF0182 family protein [Gemmatimonadales bacterium]
MVKRGRAITVVGAAVVVFLFLGRRLSVILSDYWFGTLISPDAGTFLLQFHALRALLDGAGVLVASTWFIGNLFVVYRALGTVQVPRYLANIEFRETLTPNVLLGITVALGGLLGLMVGLGASEWWADLALAWQGVVFGVADPLLGHDLGVYLAQLPWWRTLRGFCLFLVVAGLLLVLLLYTVIGSLRLAKGRLAISNHARAHLGALLAALALCLAWGYVLLPFEILAGLHGSETAGSWAMRTTAIHVLTGTALAASALSLMWALRPRHALVLATWIVLPVASFIVQVVLPGLAADDSPAFRPQVRKSLERQAFALEPLETETVALSGGVPSNAPLVEPWSQPMIRRLIEVDSARVVGMAPGTLIYHGVARPVWLTVAESNRRVAISAIAADRTTAAGGAMSFQMGDTTAYPSVLTLGVLDSIAGASWPGAPSYHIGTDGRGVPLDSWIRRVVLAWGLQVAGLLGDLPDGSTLSWHRDPIVRASRLAPFARWEDAQPVWHDGRLWWLVTGFVLSETFPGVEPVGWGGRPSRLMRPGFLAVIDADSKETSLYLVSEAGPVAQGWAALAGPMVQPTSAIPPSLLRAYRYPRSLAEVQASVLSRPWWNVGIPIRELGDGQPRLGGIDVGWVAAGQPGFTAVYHRRSSRRLSALLRGHMADGVPFLRLALVDSVAGAATPALLQQRWARFPLFEQIRDSVRQDGTSLEHGRVKYFREPGGIVAQAPHYAVRDGARARVAWYSLAAGERLGAGRTPGESWRNLIGAGVPVPPGSGPGTPFDEAQRWMRIADSALTAGDWETFGRAFGALRELLREPEL